jgi:hypothetical protein
LHDSSGNIVGVVSAKLDALRMVKATGDIPQNINFAIKTGALRDFLDNSAVPYQTADAGSEMKTADIASAGADLHDADFVLGATARPRRAEIIPLIFKGAATIRSAKTRRALLADTDRSHCAGNNDA